ncbi:MAG: glycosyltransferase family 4 protein [Terriglobales bacterium]
MRILVSAYACEPNKGSEPGVGWNWAVELARIGHDVTVLTRENNRETIELQRVTVPFPNLRFIYYDLPRWARRWKRRNRGVHLYYLLWQWGAYLIARRLVREHHFDRVHHVTFVSVRQPSFMGLLGIPFTFGPVAGGERAPWRLRKSFPLRGWLRDALRDIANGMVRFDPLMWLTFSTAEQIFVTSEATQTVLPRKFHVKTRVQLAVGLDRTLAIPMRVQRGDGEFRVLYVGTLSYLKGIHLALRAFRIVQTQIPGAKLTIIGEGPEEKWLKCTAARLKLDNSVEWRHWIAREELLKQYAHHDAFLFPSLHDSGGMVVLEAIAAGLPVVCLDIGGPAAIVNRTKGCVVATGGRGEADVVADIARALQLYAETDSPHERRFFPEELAFPRVVAAVTGLGC